MDPLTINVLIAIVTALASSGGVVAFYRARKETKANEKQQDVDQREKIINQLWQQQGALSAKIDALETSKDKVEENASTLGRQVERLQVEAEYTKRNADQQASEITRLTTENIDQARRLKEAEDARADATQKWQTELAMRQFLERENNALRTEVDRLHDKIKDYLNRVEIIKEQRIDDVNSP